MKSLVQYYFDHIESDYKKWLENRAGDGVPGRLVLREFEPSLVNAIYEKIQKSDLPITPIGSQSGFIIAVEDHEHYQQLQVDKYSFADLTHERNRVGDYYCLMFIAETKPTHDQVSSIDQNIIFDTDEIYKWVEIAKKNSQNQKMFSQADLNSLANFINELTNTKWHNRPFIKIDKINDFIENVIYDTANSGLLWDAIGKNCTYLGGIKRLDDFRVLKDLGKNFRQVFRKTLSNTLLIDISFWRGQVKNKEVEKTEIEKNIKIIRNSGSAPDGFCDLIEQYFDTFFSEPEKTKNLQNKIQNLYDSQAPFSSVLQQKKVLSNFKLGEETINFCSDNDIKISQNDIEILKLVDDKRDKPDQNALRKFYFSYSKDISISPKLEKAWLKEVSSSRITESTDFIEGLLSILCKSIFLVDIGSDKVQLNLAKDRSKNSLNKKNRDALNFFFNEYRDLNTFWSLFGDNFETDFPAPFTEKILLDPDNKDLKSNRSSKAANELYFRIIRYSESPNKPTDSWEFKWVFNPYGFESVKYYDFAKILTRKGYHYKHVLSIDPLFVKRADTQPSIANCQIFQSISSSMRRGQLVRKSDKESESKEIELLLQKLLKYEHLSNEDYQNFECLYDEFITQWHKAVKSTLESPLLVELMDFEYSFNKILDFLIPRTVKGESFRDLLYEFLSSNTLVLDDKLDFAVYLPWSTYSLLLCSKKNAIYRQIAALYKQKQLIIGNINEGVLSKLICELNKTYGKNIFLRKREEATCLDLICTQISFGYFEYTSLSNSKNALNEKEIRSVIKGSIGKFVSIFPHENRHLRILCSGLNSYDHILAVYSELLKFFEEQEETISLSLIFTCNNRVILDNIYQRVCESFDSSTIDNLISIRIINNLDEIEDGEIDILLSFDPLYTTNTLTIDASRYIVSEDNSSFWEYCSSRKIPSNPITKKSSFALNNHIMDLTSANYHKAFMLSAGENGHLSFCREVAQKVLNDEVNKGLRKSNWLVIYDYLITKDILNINESDYDCSELISPRVLRYVQGEGLNRSLAIITDKDTQYITNNLETSIRNWKIVHPDNIKKLVNEIFTLSNSFSSDVLLRSVGNGNFSHDLVGTAGSTLLIQSLLRDDDIISNIFWIHLDDYMGWFKSSIDDDILKSIGRTVNYISDLMGIYIKKEPEDCYSINIIICESKLSNDCSLEQTVKSCKQVKSTCELVKSMLDTSKAFDFRYWLNKFLEFIIGNLKFSPNHFDFTDLLNIQKESVKINLYGLSVLFHYDNQTVKSEFNNIFDSSYLSQIKLSFEDTKSVFNHMIDPSSTLDLTNLITLTPIKLNVDTSVIHEDSKQSCPENSTDSVTGINNNSGNYSPIHTSVIISGNDNPKLSTATLNSQVNYPYDISNPVLKLIEQCISFLEINQENRQENIIDIDSVKAGIRKIFSHADLPSSFSDVIITPNSIVVKLHGNVHLVASKIMNMRGIFLSVVGLSLRQVYPEPGLMTLVFDRDERETVYLVELIKRAQLDRVATLKYGFNNKIIIGQNEFSAMGCYFKLDGASPHALIGGQTKSGKSILLNNMITDLMITNTPQNLKLRLFDPKQVEFASYSRSPHLAHPVVLDKDEAIIRLKELEELMNQRYVELRELGLKDIEAYNLSGRGQKMSREVVFFDELADWILDNDFKQIAKDIIIRLSSKGRAAGVHLVLATQRPSNDVVFPLLRANLDTKIALKVDRDLNSEIILGESGAENLLGYGHGIVKTEGQTINVQVGYTETHLFDALINFVIDYWNDARNICNNNG